MICNLKEILEIGEKGGFAVPAFNVYNLETVMGIKQAAEETGSPVIFQMYSRLFDSDVAKYVAPIIKQAMDDLKTPCAFHLDHGAGLPEVMRALHWGATSIMIDRSTYSFDENVAYTKNVVDLCGECGVFVEGEIGHVGTTKDATMPEYTKVSEAVEFAEKTGVDALAIAVGTAHGHYAQAPVLAIDRIREIHEATPVHLVLHGGSGVPDDQIKKAIAAGIRKINIGTDVCCSFLDGCRAVDPGIYALDLFMREPTKRVKEFAINRIQLLGSDK